MVKKCCQCRASVGPRSVIHCDYHAGYHNGRSTALMKIKRENPDYREQERVAVKERMRSLRSKRKSAAVGEGEG